VSSSCPQPAQGYELMSVGHKLIPSAVSINTSCNEPVVHGHTNTLSDQWARCTCNQHYTRVCSTLVRPFPPCHPPTPSSSCRLGGAIFNHTPLNQNAGNGNGPQGGGFIRHTLSLSYDDLGSLARAIAASTAVSKDSVIRDAMSSVAAAGGCWVASFAGPGRVAETNTSRQGIPCRLVSLLPSSKQLSI
jgi:hypothetical protein